MTGEGILCAVGGGSLLPDRYIAHHTMPPHISPTTLRGNHITLEPFALHHAEGLARTYDPETFRHFATWSGSPDPAEVRAEITRALATPSMLSFTAIENDTGDIIGSSAYLDIRPEHRTLEIGRTWIIPRYRGTSTNPEMKLLMLAHAFETPIFSGRPAERVQLKTDARNVRSQAAIAKLGAVREGVLRKHMIMPDGFVRDTVMFSITRAEWPGVKAGLESRLAK